MTVIAERGTAFQWKQHRTSRLDHAIVRRTDLELNKEWKGVFPSLEQDYKEAVNLAQVTIFSLYLDVLAAGNMAEIQATQRKLVILRHVSPPEI